MLEELQGGATIFIFPEGTRNKGDKPLNAFYDGAFRFGVESGFPIVAMCAINARAITPSDNYSVRPGTIEIQYLGPYETKGLKRDDVDALKQRIHNDMYKVLEERDPMFNKNLKA
jgi:1-acyl-sn-glycerol-3-phosphate acyltransferase